MGSTHGLARQGQENVAFLWLLGGGTVNYHLRSDSRVDHGEALDKLPTQVIASLADQGAVKAR